MSISTLKIRLA